MEENRGDRSYLGIYGSRIKFAPRFCFRFMLASLVVFQVISVVFCEVKVIFRGLRFGSMKIFIPRFFVFSKGKFIDS